MLLSPLQIVELTGYLRPGKQVDALQRMGVRHWVRLDGRPVVDDSALTHPGKSGAPEPDWSGINGE